MKVGRAARLKRLRKVLAPVAVGIAAAASTFYALRRPLPRTDAELWPGRIAFDVQVVRDRWGVPHVYAATFDDLFFAQGYVHAQDRLWQMELNRRASAGTLSEVLGEAAVEADRLLRRLGFRRSALAEPPRLSDQARRALEAYVQGVNAYIDGNRHRLPIEFGLLRFQPAAWTPVDSLAFAGLMAWSLSMNWDTELIRARIVRSIGAERASALEPDYPGGHLSTVPSGADDRLFDDRFLVDY
ncbi:MAG: penicillin acylase family protein, partial [Chloroflexi bacterium]|nr:penicillin acylase family protein [Chloroflexota bacterium]